MNSNLFRAWGLAAAALCSVPAAAIDIDVREVASARDAAATAFAADRFDLLAAGEPVLIQGLPLGEQRVDLELEPFSVWTDDAVFMIDENPRTRPELTLLRGRVAGADDSLVVVGVGAFATNGFIEVGEKTYVLSTGARDGVPAQPTDLLITDLADVQLADDRPVCAIDETNFDAFAPLGQPVYDEAQLADQAARGDAPCRVARIAIDTDWEWTAERFGGNAEAAAEYSLFLMAAISEVYRRDVNVRLVVPFLRTFSSNVDPYTGSTTPDPLIQVRDHWRSAMQHVERDLTHLFTGANTSYGGVAYVSVICNQQWGFGVSSYMDGAFPYPLQQNSGQNWDLVVVSHELGHNFGTLHTHDGYTPTIDDCGNGCVGDLNGTIMSYCHVCPGGLPNIDLRFHPRVQDRILAYLAIDAPCTLQPLPGAGDDTARAVPGEPVDIFVLGNDNEADCAAVGLASVQSPTPGGATVTIEGWDNPTGDPTGFFLRYTAQPEQTGTDTFTYTNSAGRSASVTVDMIELRQPEFVPVPQPGLEAAWYDIGPGNAVVPDFGGFEPIQSGTVPNLNFPSTNQEAVGGPLSDNIGAVFEGYLKVPTSGLYTLELESDDGSLLYVGDDLVVDNNGLHGMRTAGGSAALLRGNHPVRIEFFENGGGAGLIFRWSGPGASGVVRSTELVYPDPCPADLADPQGVLDLSDINLFVGAFQIGLPAADLAAPEGVYDLADVVAFIASFTGGCP